MVLNNSIIEHVEKYETFKESEIIFNEYSENPHTDEDAKTYYNINIKDLRNCHKPSSALYSCLSHTGYWIMLPPL